MMLLHGITVMIVNIMRIINMNIDSIHTPSHVHNIIEFNESSSAPNSKTNIPQIRLEELKVGEKNEDGNEKPTITQIK